MLDQLVESREGYGDAGRRGGFLLTTMVLIVSLFASGLLWSLFAKDLGMGDESLELSSLVAPVPVPSEAPPAPEPIIKEKVITQNSVQNELPARRENILRTDESPIIPKDVSTSPLQNRARPNTTFTISTADTDGTPSSTAGNSRSGGDSGGTGINASIKPEIAEDTEKDPPPALKPAATPPQKPLPPRSIGVVNGKAITLPKPPYPAPAQALHVGGEVSVQVLIDEQGRVVSAKAVSGHPLLRATSEAAARSATFNATLLNNQPVKVTGVIIYKFAMQ